LKIALGIGMSIPRFVQQGGVWVPADTAGLVAVYDPTEGQEGQVLEDTFGGNDGQLGSTPSPDTNDPSWQADPPALVYDGTDWVDCGGDSDGSFADLVNEVTLVAVVRRDTTSAFRAVFSKRTASTDTQYSLRRHSNGTPQATFVMDATPTTERNITGAVAITTTGYDTMIFSHKSGDQKLYHNAVSVGTPTTFAGALESNDAAKLYVGRLGTGFTGFEWVGHIGVCMLYGAWKSGAGVVAIHNDIANSFPGYGLSVV